MAEDSGDDDSEDSNSNSFGISVDNLLPAVQAVNQIQRDWQEVNQQLNSAIQPYYEAQQAVSQLQASSNFINDFAEQMSSIQETVQQAQEYLEAVRNAVESTIDLEEPWDYDPDTAQIDEDTKTIAARWGLEFLDEIEQIDDGYFDPIENRMKIGLQAFLGFEVSNEDVSLDVEPRPHEAIYIFTSTQDALMHWLCEQDDDVEPWINSEYETAYRTSDKKEVFLEKYTAFFGVAEDEDTFEENLDSFYKHRNFIMHGNPGAYFDMNIATASLLFLALTLHTVIEEHQAQQDGGTQR